MSEEKIKSEAELNADNGPLSPEELEQVSGGVAMESTQKHSQESNIKTPQ